jgi:hypothetical protein
MTQEKHCPVWNVFSCVCLPSKILYICCLPVNALKTELDIRGKQMSEKAGGINRLRHEREKHRSELENITHEISGKCCTVGTTSG